MSAHLVQLIEAEELRGRGHEQSPSRMVKVYYMTDGTKVAESDMYVKHRLLEIGDDIHARGIVDAPLVREIVGLIRGDF